MNLKSKLNYHYKKFDKSQITPDPLEFPHKFKNYFDIEISAFISSIFAYGNVNQILKILKIIHQKIEMQPYDFVINFSSKEEKIFDGIKYRFYSDDDVKKLFRLMKIIYSNYGSIKKFFLLYYFADDINLKNSIIFFSENLNKILERESCHSVGSKFMFPNPKQGSACKRLNLFLRWMVRRDELDLGLWNEISASQLLIPVDTHIATVCKKLNLTKRKIADWKMAEEITENLKQFSPTDPVKYDFAICHLGMRKLKF